MRNKIMPLYKLFLGSALSNKLALAFNIIFPLVYFIFSNVSLIASGKTLTNEQLSTGISYYFAYIVLTTALNSIIFTMIEQREVGYYKTLYMLTNSSAILLISNILAQLTFLTGELLLFDLVAIIMARAYASTLMIILTTLLAEIILVLPLVLMLSIMLVFKTKLQSSSVLITIIILASFGLAGIQSNNAIANLLVLFTPIRYLTSGFELCSKLLVGQATLSGIISLLTVIIVYIGIGVACMPKYAITATTKR